LIRTHWAANPEESRASLQGRLTLLWKIMFWAYVVLLGAQYFLWNVANLGGPRPAYQNGIYAAGVGGLALMAFIWRGLLVRRELPLRWLNFIDHFYSAGSGVVLGGAALLAYNYPPSHYVSLIYAYIAVFARVIVVPSSGPRTLVNSIETFLPIVIAAIILAAEVNLLAPGPVYAIGATLLGAVAILLATTGSDLIYGLRRQVSAAQQLGAYKLERKIGEGGIGAVYLAHHIMLRRPTAVKALLPERIGADTIERFEREVRAMSQLSHPNTVHVYDYGRSPDGLFYYAMEYLGGGIDLERLVKKFGPQPSGRVVQILTQVCGALGEAHENNIIHRDIKPANIMLCERGGMPDIVKVVDYGLVKEIAGDGGESQQVILGTPAYVAPEAITDPKSVGPACDLYALGAVGYFLLTGRRVFEAKTSVEMCIQHVTATPQPPSKVASIHVAPELEAIIMRCLQKQPAERFGSAAEMAEALRALPATKDWDLPDARAWWKEFKAHEQEEAVASSMSTLTITVDLGQRG
jgi:serine/threonine-protein kinase